MPTSTDKLLRLCQGVRAIAPGIEIRLKPSDDIAEHWSVMVFVGSAILIYTDFDVLENSLDQACRKLATISTRMMAAMRSSTSAPPPASTAEDAPTSVDLVTEPPESKP